MYGQITTVNGHENFFDCYITDYRMDAGWWNTIDVVIM